MQWVFVVRENDVRKRRYLPIRLLGRYGPSRTMMMADMGPNQDEKSPTSRVWQEQQRQLCLKFFKELTQRAFLPLWSTIKNNT